MISKGTGVRHAHGGGTRRRTRPKISLHLWKSCVSLLCDFIPVRQSSTPLPHGKLRVASATGHARSLLWDRACTCLCKLRVLQCRVSSGVIKTLVGFAELNDVHVGGLSMGGLIAARAVQLRPDLFRSLILMNSFLATFPFSVRLTMAVHSFSAHIAARSQKDDLYRVNAHGGAACVEWTPCLGNGLLTIKAIAARGMHERVGARCGAGAVQCSLRGGQR